MAACDDTVPNFPPSAPSGTWTMPGVAWPSKRQRISVSGAISNPSSEGVNIGRQRGGKSAHSPLSGPECLKMPAAMSASTIASTIAAAKSSVRRHPSRRQTSQRINA